MNYKVLLSFTILLLIGREVLAQKTDSLNNGISIDIDSSIFPEVMPSFPGGEAKMIRYIIEHMNMDGLCLDKSDIIKTKVVVAFTVDTSGSLTQIKIRKSINPEIDEELIRVLKSMPPWNPALSGNQKIPFEMVIPIRFHFG